MESEKKSISEWLNRLGIIRSFLLALIGGIIYIFFLIIANGNLGDLLSGLFIGSLFGLFVIHPWILTLMNLLFLLLATEEEEILQKARQIEILTIVEGGLYSVLLFSITNIRLADWTETLRNAEVHTPIWTEGMLTVVVLCVMGFLGYLYLRSVKINKVPPLTSVLAMAGMYIGMFMCILWVVQIFKLEFESIYLCLFPFNCLLIVVKVIREKVKEWDADQAEQPKLYDNPMLDMLNQKLMNAANWPVLAFILMVPLLGVCIGILVLFGQQPDAVIRAWTETADWNLSTKVAPQNIFYDEHYLCTVAAGGHEKVVKPLRMGKRHGHPVIVNRQLCVANAFEQILEEKTPRFHKCVRGFYDKYGFPIAKSIKSPFIADIIYFIMKPAEWLFLIVLYLVDENPENRIAVQYLPRRNKS